MIRVFQSRPSGDRRHRNRVVAGDHFQVNLLAVKKLQRIRRLLADHICEKEKSQRFHTFGKLGARRFLFAVGKDKDTKTFLRILFTVLCESFIPFREDKLYSSHQVGALFRKNRSAVLPV